MSRKVLLCVQVGILLLLLWLLPDLQLPPLFQYTPPHAAYRRSCYRYHPNLTAENTCCKMTNFSGALHLLHRCITRANTHLLNEAKGQTDDVGEKTNANGTEKPGEGAEGNWSSIKGVHWVLVGDSHVRYILGAFLTRFRSPGLKFRKTHTEKWEDTEEIEKIVRHNIKQRRIHVLDRDINFRMTYICDPLLTLLPLEMALWERRPQETPSLLIFAGALHWMLTTKDLYFKNGMEAAAAKYREHFRSLRPQLMRLSNRTTVVFKLLDDLKVMFCAELHMHFTIYNILLMCTRASDSRLEPHRTDLNYLYFRRSSVFNIILKVWRWILTFKCILQRTNISNSTEPLLSFRNYVLYNKIAVQELSGTGVIIWDSTRPLSTDYAHHCIKNPEMQTPPYFYWKCQDLGHVGYILVDQYADMIINDFCNKHLNIPGACL
ncbi:uncharacterized protein [Procambarus clarkii]|uniref:uncharacterized protein n=1 Tax=Procambarus clarkii TaxID=6728 RepID=UPI003742F432